MNRYACIIIIVALITSCSTKKTDNDLVKPDSTLIIIKADSIKTYADRNYFWEADQDNPKGLSMKKIRPVTDDSLTPTSMLFVLNSAHPEILLEYLKTSNDTIFLMINKSNYLTKQIGTSGAEAYLAEVTYNFTELKGVNNVDINFKEGDHAAPGTYSRTDFIRAQK